MIPDEPSPAIDPAGTDHRGGESLSTVQAAGGPLVRERPEFQFIERLRRRVPTAPQVVVGIGDDAAVLAGSGSVPTVVTTDMLMEGVDFLWPQASAARIGRKALAVNLSDLAAMGCRPTAAFVSVALPKARGMAFAEGLYDGLLALANEFTVPIAGGDTNTWDGPTVLSLTVLGVPIGPRPWLRHGARPGDWLLVTGRLGGSLAGRHLDFTPRLAEAAWLAQHAEIHAALDLSDGLAGDLPHLLRASEVGAVINAGAIPIHPDVDRMPEPDGQSECASSPTAEAGSTVERSARLARALNDGEDFELLLAVSAQDGPSLIDRWPFPTPLTAIGVCTADRSVWLEDGQEPRPFPTGGWTHSWSPVSGVIPSS